MKSFWFVIIIVAAVGIGYFVLKNPAHNAGTVTLGVIAGTTGDYAAAGEGYVNGFELARGEWNKSHQLQFADITEDDGFNAQKGVAAYAKLKSVDKVDAYAVLSSFTIDAIANDLRKEGKPVALGFEQSIPAEDDNIVQVLPAARPIQKALGQYLKELGYKRPVVVVSNNTSVYQNFYAGFVDGFGIGVLKEDLASDPVAFRSVALKVKADNPDVIVFYADPPSGALTTREIIKDFSGHLPQLAFDQSIESGIADYQQVFGNSLQQLNGTIIALSKNDFTDAFRQAYQAKYKNAAPFGSDMGYNSFMLLALTYDRSQTKWVQNMKTVHFTGADGDVSFDGVGLRVPNIYFGKLKNGQVVLAN
ncbi:ABC transporter substrate-binding protein [Candidatus Kaiserbacteria bacterium]|nr:ABC transporter substrate-binding protein [Candidatus Kaiserbacteria bacterium]